MIKLPLIAREKLARIRAELKIGLPINFQNGAFVAIEHLSAERYEMLRELPGSQILLSSARARDLGLPNCERGDSAFYLPSDVDFRELAALADPAFGELATDLMEIGIGNIPTAKATQILNLLRRTRILPAALVIGDTVEGATQITPDEWAHFGVQAISLEAVSDANVPLELAGQTRLNVYRNHDDDQEHYAIVVGNPDMAKPLVRLHSACFTGDALGSLKCDCGPQLQEALRAMEPEGGILLYLSQEGRGIGLANKIRAYSLQDRGFDTVEANHKLGFDDDQRDFRIGAEILHMMGVEMIDLLTNNPRKVKWFEQSGIAVRNRIPLVIPPRPENVAYLATKRDKSGHIL